ncbi:MAG: hypothetical protein RLZ35_1295 [Pseudomonadota bacterium]|jgi:phosphoglycolate phosphatase
MISTNTPGILFDLDGTVLDTAPDIQRVINQIREEQGLSPLPLEQVRPHVSGGSGLLATLLCDTRPSEQALLGLKKQLLHRYQAHQCEHIVFFPGMEDLLHTLDRQNIPWGIVTNRTQALAEKAISRYPVFEKAHCVVCADTTPHPKPHPAPLLHACTLLNIDPTHTVYIGDDSIDILAGKAAGIKKTLLVLFGYADPITAATWGADHLFSDSNALSDWLMQHHISP